MALKYDHPPLLGPGRHFMSLEQLQRLCVRNYGDAGGSISWQTRFQLFTSLEQLVQALLVARIRCDVFVNGSFLTKKAVPGDVDVIVTVEKAIYETLSDEQMQVFDSINDNAFAPNVDGLAFVAYPREHEHHGFGLDGSVQIEGYGVEHSGEWLKGFAVLRLWETDVGNRICR